MKSTLRLFTAAAALMLASTASADVTIYLTGSTAFRAATSNAIKNLFSSLSGTGSYNDGTTNHTGVTYGYAFDGSGFNGANHQIFIGTVNGITGTVIVKTSWNGSLQGIQSLDSPADVTNQFFDYPWVNSSVVVSSSGVNNTASGMTNDTSNATLAMADNTQGATPFTNTSLVATQVGVVPFAFVASYSAPAGVTNITPQLATALFKGGYCSASLFTNNTADQDNLGGTRIYAAGRDPLSGTRLNTFAEIGMGINTPPKQYQYSSLPGGTAITSIVLVPGNSDLLTPVGQNDGETGFYSGGDLGKMLRYDTSSVTYKTRTGKAAFISYLGEGDAVTAVQTGTVGAGNGRYLSYGGVSAFGGVQVSVADGSWTSGSATITSATTGKFTGCVVGQLVRCAAFGSDTYITAIDGTKTIITLNKNATTTQASAGSATVSVILPNPIWNGSYTMWGYEYIMWAPGTSGDQLTFGNKLANQISTVDYYASGLALTSSMLVKRFSEGGTVSQNY